MGNQHGFMQRGMSPCFPVLTRQTPAGRQSQSCFRGAPVRQSAEVICRQECGALHVNPRDSPLYDQVNCTGRRLIILPVFAALIRGGIMMIRAEHLTLAGAAETSGITGISGRAAVRRGGLMRSGARGLTGKDLSELGGIGGSSHGRGKGEGFQERPTPLLGRLPVQVERAAFFLGGLKGFRPALLGVGRRDRFSF